MGSVEKPRISKATLDKKADSSLVSILKQSFNQLEKENKELKEQIQNDTIVYNRAVFQNGILIEENKQLKNTMSRMYKETRKLKELVDKLREAIEEPKELDDK